MYEDVTYTYDHVTGLGLLQIGHLSHRLFSLLIYQPVTPTWVKFAVFISIWVMCLAPLITMKYLGVIDTKDHLLFDKGQPTLCWYFLFLQWEYSKGKNRKMLNTFSCLDSLFNQSWYLGGVIYCSHFLMSNMTIGQVVTPLHVSKWPTVSAKLRLVIA